MIAGALLAVTVPGAPALAQNVIDEWAAVKTPPPPELKPVKIDTRTTALLVLDLMKATCNNERRPRCVAQVPRVQKLLNDARNHGVPVVYTIVPGTTIADVIPQVAPKGDEPHVLSRADKSVGTDLDKILKDKGITTVLVVGTAAHGAVLYTGSAAAMRGYKAIVPVDGMSAENTYAEQYTAWALANAPTVGTQVTLTKIDLIQY
jgi:nicotinamidase-related amidase